MRALVSFVHDQAAVCCYATGYLPLLAVHVLQEPVYFVSFISLQSGVGSQLWLIGLGVLLPGLEAHVYVAGNQP